MTDEAREDVGKAFRIVGMWILTNGLNVVAVLGVALFLGMPHIDSYAGDRAAKTIVDELNKRCQKDEFGQPEDSLACDREANLHAAQRTEQKLRSLDTQIEVLQAQQTELQQIIAEDQIKRSQETTQILRALEGLAQ